MAEIVLEQVRKVYGDGTEAVRGVDLTIPDGSLAVLVGPSGCGKTTLLRLVAGLEAISAGTVRIGERVVNDVSPKDRDLAMVFQDYALYPQMSVYDNMAFGLKLRRTSKAEVRSRVHDAAGTLGLMELLSKKPRQLSGGQRQRVAMGRAIVRNPQAFLMDEPLSNLDAKLRVEMRAYIARLHQELGTTTLYVTHDQTEAMTMGDRVAVIKRGIVQQWDSPQVLYNQPANLFVAGFIGSPSMNVVEATLRRDGDAATVEFAGHRLTVPADVLAGHPRMSSIRGDARVIVGVRPEAISDAAEAPELPADGRIEAVPTLCEAIGSDVYVHFTIDAPAVLTEDIEELAADTGVEALEELRAKAAENRSEWVGRVSPRSRAAEGESITLVIDTRQLHFFDADSGEAL